VPRSWYFVLLEQLHLLTAPVGYHRVEKSHLTPPTSCKFSVITQLGTDEPAEDKQGEPDHAVIFIHCAQKSVKIFIKIRFIIQDNLF